MRGMHHLLICGALALMGALLIPAGCQQPSEPVIPQAQNIVLIYMDDLGWKDIGISGSEFYQTPHIDRLAEGGIRFTHGYAPGPLCAPSRGALMSGKYPARTKFTSVVSNAPDDALYSQSKALGVGNKYLEAPHRQNLPSTETIFAERFQEAGFATCFIGKWHCGRQPGYHPGDRGYDEVYAVRRAGGYPYYLSQQEIENLEGVSGAKPGDYLPEVMTRKACEFMERQVDEGRPFLLHLSHFLVHTPITAQRDYVEEFEERLKRVRTDQDNVAYATMVKAMDESVGAIVQKLEELGQLENTLVLFTSDNGGYTGRETTSNYPLLGGKSFSLEGAYRVPFIAHWPDAIPGGQVSETRVIGTDLYPTLLDAAGLALNPEQHVDGYSLMGEMTKGVMGGPLPSRSLFFHHPHYTHASSPHSIVIDGPFKLIRYYNDSKAGYALFNLAQDPSELNDLVNEEAEQVKALADTLDAFLEETDAEMPVPATSPEGQQLLEQHTAGLNSGWTKRYQDHTNVMNQDTERELALEGRSVQERKLFAPSRH
jgi:arylsulfatase A